MSGHTKWSEIRKLRPRTPEQEAAIQEGIREIRRENALTQLGRLHEVGQAELVEMLGMTPEEIARTEQADEPRLATLRRFVEALDGELIVQARYDGETFDLLQPSAMRNAQPATDDGQRATIPADG